MINEDQQALVRSSFTLLAAYPDWAARVFYRRFFELDPALRTFFYSNSMEQGRHFMLAISAVVTSLAAPEVIIPKLQQLGRRHQAYGIKPENYAVIKAALLYTLERVLHGDYTPEIEEAWSALYDWLVFIATDQQAFT